MTFPYVKTTKYGELNKIKQRHRDLLIVFSIEPEVGRNRNRYCIQNNSYFTPGTVYYTPTMIPVYLDPYTGYEGGRGRSFCDSSHALYLPPSTSLPPSWCTPPTEHDFLTRPGHSTLISCAQDYHSVLGSNELDFLTCGVKKG